MLGLWTPSFAELVIVGVFLALGTGVLIFVLSRRRPPEA